MRLSTSLRLNAQKGLVTPYDPALTLDLQFAARQAYVANIGPLPTFTNASTTRTFVGSDGLIQTAATNVPRIDFNPKTLACRGLLIEEQRTNSQSRSEEFGNASWAKGAVTVTDNSSTAPDGATTADLISETTANAQHTIYQGSPTGVTTGIAYTASVFVKKGTGATAPDWVQLGFLAGGFGIVRAAFNVSTGFFGNTTGSLSTSVTEFPNGWYRISVTATATVTAAWGTITFAFTNNANVSASIPTYTGQTTSDVFVWGAQFEAGAFATSYIPTTTTSIVRSADVCSITGAAFTGFYNASEGTMVCKYDRAGTASETHFCIDNGTSNERLVLQFSGTVERFVVSIGGAGSNLDSATVGAINTRIGHAARYKLNDYAFCCNGTTVVTNTTLAVPTVTQASIGNRVNALFTNGHIYAVQYYNTIKTNAQLQALSTP